MKVCIVASPRAEHQGAWGGAFRDGLRRHGIEAEISGRPEPADLLCLWGVRKQDAIRDQLASGGDVCILERGYLGDRFAHTSVSFGGGLNNRGRFYGPFEDGSRWDKHFAGLMKPWQPKESGYALILGQVPTDMSLYGMKPLDMWREAAEQAVAAGYEVRFRPHPLRPDTALPNIRRAGGTLEEALAGAALAIGINSNSTVDAVLAGVPTITLDEGAMAWPVTGHDITQGALMPDRSAWASRLAWCQFSMSEIQSGVCWDHVGHGCRV